MRAFVIAVFLSFCFLTGFGQSINELQERKQNAVREIEYTSKILSQVQEEEQASLNRLRLLNSRIEQRNILISSLNDEIEIYQQVIDDNNLVVGMLQQDLAQIKEEYAELIRFANRNKNVNNSVLFLLSAEDVNQAYRRFLYMKRYTSFRKSQTEIISEVQDLLNENNERLKQHQETRQQLVDETRAEAQKIAEERTQQNSEVQQLQQQRQGLQQQLNEQRQIEQQLEEEIQRIIEAEAAINSESGAPAYALTPEQQLVGDNFEQNKRRLPWPTERGIITEHFGIHQHPVLSNVQIRNNGINIATESGAEARAVFNGEVSRVFGITGGNSAVIIRHGSYLTVYSNLSEVTVTQGDMVLTNQSIGTIYSDADDGNRSVLKFQIWRENQKLDPEEWIAR